MESQYASPNAHVTNALGVFFIVLFIFFYAGGIDATSYVYCSELFPTHIRSQGMAFSMIGTFLSRSFSSRQGLQHWERSGGGIM